MIPFPIADLHLFARYAPNRRVAVQTELVPGRGNDVDDPLNAEYQKPIRESYRRRNRREIGTPKDIAQFMPLIRPPQEISIPPAIFSDTPADTQRRYRVVLDRSGPLWTS